MTLESMLGKSEIPPFGLSEYTLTNEDSSKNYSHTISGSRDNREKILMRTLKRDIFLLIGLMLTSVLFFLFSSFFPFFSLSYASDLTVELRG